MEFKIKINGLERIAQSGETILDVLEQEGIEVPTMCFLKGTKHFPTCMVCIVKDRKTNQLIPSCSTLITREMDVISHDEEIVEARKTALELLLSDHVGECSAPCQTGCPAFMDIPEMNRLLAKGMFEESLRVVKKDIALPAVLGRICPAPCERACRRKVIDDPVSICLLKRFAADHDLNHASPFIPGHEVLNGKNIGIIGAGPAGLSAAYFLLQKGYQCTIYDKNPLAGGALRYSVPDERLPKNILDEEIETIRKMGAVFKMNTELQKDELEKIRNKYHGVIVATGEDNADFDGLVKKHRSFIVDRHTHQSNMKGVFAIGSAIKPGRVAIRAVAHGKEAAIAMDQYLSGQPVTGDIRMFISRYGLMIREDHQAFMMETYRGPRIEKENRKGFTLEEVKKEAERCMHCDCRKKDDCKLRIFSDQYGANQRRFFPKPRAPIRKIFRNKPVVYEPEKCIKCGICVKITEMQKDNLGLSYIGKGFDVEIDIPFDHTHNQIFEETAKLCAENCPTGALAMK